MEYAKDETLLQLLIRQLALLIDRALDHIPGQLPFDEYKFLYPEIWLHAVTSLVLLLCFLALHTLVFSTFRRKAQRRNQRYGPEDFPARVFSRCGAL